MKQYDVIVIGGGGGTKIVSPAARLGLKVAILEKETLGGTCLNRGCIPSKMLIHPADVIQHTREAAKFELGLHAEFNVDFEKLVTRVSNTVDRDSASIGPAYIRNPNIDYYPHEGRFIADKIVEVNGEQITADKIFIAVGSRPLIPKIDGLNGTPYMTSREALRNTVLPKSLLVIGGGFIAVELGHVYSSFGSDVHFIVRSELLRSEDEDIIEEFKREFSKRNSIHAGHVPLSVEHDGSLFHLKCKTADSSTVVHHAEALLVATGVRPNTDLLGLEHTGVKLDQKGQIIVDSYLETNVKGVYALGDCIGRYLFRHTVNYEGEYLMRTLFTKPAREPLDYGPVPRAVFTHPQIANVGKTERELQAEGVDYVVGKNSYAKSAMGMARLSDNGFVKLLVDRRSRKILGAHIIGDEASDMIHLYIMAMKMGATVDDVLDMIFIHPALPEIARNAARQAHAALETRG